jgi:hypothetical protein
MRKETVEIYSDASNMAVMRHPGRQFPGVLIQGDTLHSLLVNLEQLNAAVPANSDEAIGLAELIEQVTAYVDHYRKVLTEHGIELPWPEKRA